MNINLAGRDLDFIFTRLKLETNNLVVSESVLGRDRVCVSERESVCVCERERVA